VTGCVKLKDETETLLATTDKSRVGEAPESEKWSSSNFSFDKMCSGFVQPSTGLVMEKWVDPKLWNYARDYALRQGFDEMARKEGITLGVV